MLARYTGPVWGTHLHSIYTAQKRPLLIGVIKPSYGLDAESHFQRAQDILIGGADVAKDDENLSAGEPANPLIKRIAMAREVIERAQEQTGLPKLYVLNLQHESMILGVLPMIETINAQHPHPILGILWSPVLGVPFIRMLRGETKAPVFCHSSGMAQFVGGRFSLSRRAYATVVRLAGADALIHSPPVEGAWATKLSDIHSLCDGAMREYGHLTSMLCCFGGGLAMDQVDRVSRAISYYNFGYLVGGAFLSGAGTPRGCAQALSQELVRVTQDLRLPIKQ
jgi:ribulose 1,5-bisphosphate carboxylase large subunit-like protein